MQMQIKILGFDCVGFVHEVTETVARYAQILGVTLEADGVRAVGKLQLYLQNTDQLNGLLLRLKTITGLVKVTAFT